VLQCFFDPTWSPDGQLIGFDRLTGDADLFGCYGTAQWTIESPTGSGLRGVFGTTSRPDAGYVLAWAHDSMHVLFDNDGNPGVVDVGTGAVTSLVGQLPIAAGPWPEGLPDNTFVASDGHTLLVLGTDGSVLRTVSLQAHDSQEFGASCRLRQP
jgi:hypothetical protein